MLRRTGKKQGFTLVELLVVIGIIALLLSILMPSLAKARDAANTINCASNMRQLGQGIMLYAQDWKGLLPSYCRWDDQSWVSLVAQELNIKVAGYADTDAAGTSKVLFANWSDEKVFRCPGDDSYKALAQSTPVVMNDGTTLTGNGGARVEFGYGAAPGWTYAGGHHMWGLKGLGTSYFANFRVLATNFQYMSGTDSGGWSEAGWIYGHPLARYKGASDRLVLTEKLASTVQGGGGLVGSYTDWALIGPWNAWGATYSGNNAFFADRIVTAVYGHHRRTSNVNDKGSANVLFLDGHVDLLPVKDIIKPAQNIIAANPTTAAGQPVIDANQQYWGGYGH